MPSSSRKVLTALRSYTSTICNPVASKQAQNVADGKVVKHYSEIPRKASFLPSQFGLIMSGGPSYLHEHCHRRHRELGPIFREKLGAHELVFIADTDMIRTVIANEGSQPHHNVPEAWLLYNSLKGVDRGLFFQVGEPWVKLRRVFNKVLLSDPTKIAQFTSALLDLNEDFLESWTNKYAASDTNYLVIGDIKRALCCWSIETTGLMLFGRRMGCIQGAKTGYRSDTRAEKLVSSVADMFHQTSIFQIVPPKLAMKLNFPSWKKFEQSSDTMLEIAGAYSAEFIELAKSDDSSVSIVKDLIDMKSLTDEEISKTMVDLVIAAADTTSNALQWVLYSLAKHPDMQSRMRDEIKTSINEPSKVMLDPSAGSSYRHAFVKEVQRLYPTAPFLARTLNHGIYLGGYNIPAGTPIIFSLYTTSRMERYFKDHLTFKPERWLRDSARGTSNNDQEISRRHAYASLPFGIGSRMCIGRRLADLEMDLLIVSLMNRFEISQLDDSEEVSIKLTMTLGPSRPIKLQLKPRSQG